MSSSQADGHWAGRGRQRLQRAGDVPSRWVARHHRGDGVGARAGPKNRSPPKADREAGFPHPHIYAPRAPVAAARVRAGPPEPTSGTATFDTFDVRVRPAPSARANLRVRRAAPHRVAPSVRATRARARDTERGRRTDAGTLGRARSPTGPAYRRDASDAALRMSRRRAYNCLQLPGLESDVPWAPATSPRPLGAPVSR